MRALLVTFVLVAIFLSSGCIDCQEYEEHYESIELENGNQIKVGKVGWALFSRGRKAYQVNYLTKTDLTNEKLLRTEAEIVFQHFRQKIENASAKSVILSAQEQSGNSPNPTGKLFNFVLEKTESGSWEWINRDEPE